jgi:hypothetical protein
MTKMTTARSAAPLAVLGLILAGCGGSSGKSASPATSGTGSSASTATASTSSPAPGFASTSAGTPKGVLSKPDFLIEMNAKCKSFIVQVKALPTPTGATDFTAITANLNANLKLVPSFISQAEALVNKTAERAVLEKNWLSVEKADFAAFKPVAQRMVVHSKAHDAAKVQADANALSAVPDHSSTLAAYLKGYGLTTCAELESL